MAQTLKNRIRVLADKFNIDAIITMAKEVKADIEDEQLWNAMSDQQKLDWFYAQCKKYKLTTSQRSNQISVKELPCVGDHGGSRAYFCVFLPQSLHEDGHRETELKLEIGSAYASPKHGYIWMTASGLKGKERQIAEVIKLNKLGK
jgi:hypothetical protein